MTDWRRGFLAGATLGLAAAGGIWAWLGGPVEAQTSVRAINLPGRTVNLFSDAILAGDTLYLAGRLGLEDGRPPATVAQEARNVLDSIQQVLAEAGMTMDNIVQLQVFCSDVSYYAEFNDVYREYFGDRPPARAFLGSGELLAGARFEVMGIAVRE